MAKLTNEQITLDTKGAIISHYIHNIGTPYAATYTDMAYNYLYPIQEEGYNTVASDAEMPNGLFPELNNIPFKPSIQPKFTFIDLFAGMGGFRLAMQAQGGKCVFSSEWNPFAQKTYLANFGEVPFGDITKDEIKAFIPKQFDVLCAGFPCQPFSIAGVSKK